MADTFPRYPTVFRPGKAPREVRNLGWLRRNWRDVQSVELRRPADDTHWTGAYLTATLDDGGSYTCQWADYALAVEWLDRPIFRGLPLKLATGEAVTIGSLKHAAGYRALLPWRYPMK